MFLTEKNFPVNWKQVGYGYRFTGTGGVLMQIHIARDSGRKKTETGSPRLLYVCKLDGTELMYPRSAPTHSGLVEFVYVISGQGEYEIDNVRYPVRAGDLVIYNSDTVHCEFVNHNMLPILCCAAEGILLPGQKPDCMIESGVSPVFHLDEKSYMFRQLMQMIFDEALRGNRYSHLVCQSLFESLFYLTLDVIRQGNEKSAVWGRPENSLGYQIHRYVDSQPVTALSVSLVAGYFGISESYLARVFKRTFGYSLTSYFIERKIGEAQTLLMTTDLSTAEISRRIGYKSPSYFTKAFVHRVGLPPLRYRKLYKKDGKS